MKKEKDDLAYIDGYNNGFNDGYNHAEKKFIDNDLSKAEWVNVNEELPKQEGIYFILTNEHLTQGIATYFKDEDTGEIDFDVWWAVSGKEPKVEYWLKDNHWGLVYQFKKELGEIK